LFRTAPLFIAIGGTAELCFLVRLLIKAVTPPRTRQASSCPRHRGTSRRSAPGGGAGCPRSMSPLGKSPLPGKCAG